MNDPQRDSDLKARFQELRVERRGSAPDFAAMMARAREQAELEPQPEAGRSARVNRRRVRWWWTGGSLAAAAAAAAVVFFSADARADREFERVVESYVSAAGAWRSPTDALLTLPGSELTRSVPSFGTPNRPGGAGSAPRSDRS